MTTREALKNQLAYFVKTRSDEGICSCGARMSYSGTEGRYTCPRCGKEVKDLYGKMLALREINPSLSMVEMATCLDVPVREISRYVEGNHIVNPAAGV